MSSPRHSFAHPMATMTIAEIEQCDKERIRDAALELGITSQYEYATHFRGLSKRHQATIIHGHFRQKMPDPLPAEMDAAVADERMKTFGKDHWTLLLYIEACCVDYCGVLDRRRMRCNPKTHEELAHSGSLGWSDFAHSTRWADGTRSVPGHDDWDCFEDLQAVGLLELLGSTQAIGMHGSNDAEFICKLTDAGWQKAGELRRARAERAISRD